MTEVESGSPWLKELFDLFAPTQESLKGYAEEEINQAIDDAIRAVRTKEEPDPEIDQLVDEVMRLRRERQS